jgi:outer membrane protein OmpA-like peptidoglycan-associated protein
MTYQKKTGLTVLVIFLLSGAYAEVLDWQSNPGQQYQAATTIQESVTSLSSTITKPQTTSTETASRELASGNKSTIPWLHGILSFPKTSLTPGMKWTDKASFTPNLALFGYNIPVVVTFQVSCTLLEMADIDSRTYYHIRAEWYPFYIAPPDLARRTGITRLSGYSTMDIFWDNKSGNPKRILLTEELQYRFRDGTSYLYKGDTTQEIKTETEIAREKMIEDLNAQIMTRNVANVEVKQSDAGVVLSIENIQFDAESTKLADSEKAKLTKIGGLFASLKNRKLEVIGHAANVAGSTEAELVTLSAGRAQAVADFLVQSGFKTADSIIATGMGGAKPLASNDTPEGRFKNRRVEIVIADEEVKK